MGEAAAGGAGWTVSWELLGILAYIVLQLIVGIAVSRGIRTEDDYLLAGRSLGYWMATFSIFATWFGSESCIGAAGRIHSNGLSGGSQDPFGYGCTLLLMGGVFAAALWRRRFTTIADLFRRRFGPGVESLAVLLIVPTGVLWAAAQIKSFGGVLAHTGSMSEAGGIVLATVVVLAYTITGGLLADAWTDLVQGFLMIFGLALLFWLVVADCGGPAAAWAALPAERKQLFPELFASPMGFLKTLNLWMVPVLGQVLASELVSRVLAARSENVARRSALMAGVLYIVVGLMPAICGLLAIRYIAADTDPEQVLIKVADHFLPGPLYIVFAGALVSAILSTVDSALLVAASLFAHNVVHRAWPNVTEATKVRNTRLAVFLFGVIAFLYALLSEKDSIEIVVEASALSSAGIFICGVFALATTSFGGPAAAYATLAVGTAAWLAAKYAYPWCVGVEECGIEYILALAAAFLAYVGVSLATLPNAERQPTPPTQSMRPIGMEELPPDRNL